MIPRFWLMDLPADDPAFAPLNRVALIASREYDRVRAGHRDAVINAAGGMPLDLMEIEAKRRYADADHTRSRADELEAWGYALGVTAVRVALREHDEQAVQEVA